MKHVQKCQQLPTNAYSCCRLPGVAGPHTFREGVACTGLNHSGTAWMQSLWCVSLAKQYLHALLHPLRSFG